MNLSENRVSHTLSSICQSQVKTDATLKLSLFPNDPQGENSECEHAWHMNSCHSLGKLLALIGILTLFCTLLHTLRCLCKHR